MTQTNKEREEYENFEAWLCTLNSFSPSELRFGFIAWQAAKQSPISQNEQQEAVAWRYVDSRGNYRYRGYVDDFDKEHPLLKPIPLYTLPPKQAIPEGWKLVPIEPSDDHLKSMAIRSDHGLGVDGYYDTKPIQFGASHAQRMESTIREMRQLYEEAIGEGFYKLPAPTNTEVVE